SGRQCRVGVAKDRSNRLKGWLGGSLNPHIEIGAFVETVTAYWKIGLLPFFAKTSIADVRHDADDLNIRLDVRSRAWSDTSSEGALAAQISLHKSFVDNGHTLSAIARRPRITLVKVSSRDDSGPERCKELGADCIQMDLTVGDDSLAGLNRHGIVPGSTSQ